MVTLHFSSGSLIFFSCFLFLCVFGLLTISNFLENKFPQLLRFLLIFKNSICFCFMGEIFYFENIHFSFVNVLVSLHSLYFLHVTLFLLSYLFTNFYLLELEVFYRYQIRFDWEENENADWKVPSTWTGFVYFELYWMMIWEDYLWVKLWY